MALLGILTLSASLPIGCWNGLAGYGTILILLIGIAQPQAGYLLRRIIPAVVFALFICIFQPFFGDMSGGKIYFAGMTLSRQGTILLGTVVAKSAIAVAAISVLCATTPIQELIKGFSNLHFPKLLIQLTSISHRYLSLFRDELRRMIQARDSRGYQGRWLWQASTIGYLAGTLFVRTLNRGEKIYAAMLSRGYNGELFISGPPSIRIKDFVFTSVIVGASTALRIIFWR